MAEGMLSECWELDIGVAAISGFRLEIRQNLLTQAATCGELSAEHAERSGVWPVRPLCKTFEKRRK